MEIFDKVEDIKKEVMNTIENQSLTYEQQTYRLSKIAENVMDYPILKNDLFYEMYNKGKICDLDEGHAPYAPRYILPDYEKLLREGSEFLRLTPAKNLRQAINSLLIFYHHVPSITRFPVYIGSLDTLLEPFVDEVNDDVIEEIKLFLIQLDRTINDSFCHANIGPYETKVGNIILDIIGELQNVTPNMTLLYDSEITPDNFAEKAIKASLDSANPAFANLSYYKKDFNGIPFGIASCYNALPTTGGAFTLSRIRLNKIADDSKDIDDFINRELPKVVDTLLHFMESKIDFLVNKTSFFESNFLVREGFVKLENFVGLFGVVGLHECIETLSAKEGKTLVLGTDKEAKELGVKIMDQVEELVNNFTSKYSPVWNNKFMLHAQVGAANDKGTTAGTRIQIGKEPDIYQHIRTAARLQQYFPSGTGDHFPFESTAEKNPKAILDIFRGAFKLNMRYISCYKEDGDLIRVTGYLVKKSDLEKFNRGEQVSYDTVQYAQDPLNEYGILERKVQNV
ncbi:YjjI family glycine radical enzyme [Tissierella sp. MB52-C2]|uniref:YjjI family glycine radical enzyme n=1 Tax=Tissierella sp. MB52-C2 TaxID=3070999 RepID=UPI00280AFC30|nr:YjjI family glycine radical enzyme [Tissierella sp. MB52-C2]WMM24780.1 YjjI family glycine radical enzyme [Tissierella sp. MB52-C2]